MTANERRVIEAALVYVRERLVLKKALDETIPKGERTPVGILRAVDDAWRELQDAVAGLS